MDYRTAEARAPIVLVARGRARTWLIGLGAALVAFSAIFAMQARLTVTCKDRTSGAVPRRATCHVQQARLVGSAKHDVTLIEQSTVTVREEGDRSVIAADGVEILRTALPADQLTEMRATIENVARGRTPYGVAHAGGRTLDLQLVLYALTTATALALFATRKYRVILDVARKEIRAVSYVGIIPWSTKKTRIAPGDRATVERDGPHTRLVLLRNDTRIVLVEEDGPGKSLEQAATRVSKEIEDG